MSYIIDQLRPTQVERGLRNGLQDAIDGEGRGETARHLAARGLRVTKKVDRRLRAERDEAVVDRWLGRAASCASVDVLIDQ